MPTSKQKLVCQGRISNDLFISHMNKQQSIKISHLLFSNLISFFVFFFSLEELSVEETLSQLCMELQVFSSTESAHMFFKSIFQVH